MRKRQIKSSKSVCEQESATVYVKDGVMVGGALVDAGRKYKGVLHGTPGRDVIYGTSGKDEIHALGGDDVICGFGGDDLIFGGAGKDLIIAGEGDDRVRGQEGDDRIDGQGGEDVISGNEGEDLCIGEKVLGCEYSNMGSRPDPEDGLVVGPPDGFAREYLVARSKGIGEISQQLDRKGEVFLGQLEGFINPLATVATVNEALKKNEARIISSFEKSLLSIKIPTQKTKRELDEIARRLSETEAFISVGSIMVLTPNL